MNLEEAEKNLERNNILRQIEAERDRQDSIWGTCFPDRDWDRWLTILIEEVGEVAQAILENNDEEAIREELVQVAAGALSALEYGAPEGFEAKVE